MMRVMAKSIAEQLRALKPKIEGQAKKVLNEGVADKVIEIGKKNVQSAVYDAYQPLVYKRTNKLRDKSWEKIPVECGVIIRNNRTDGDKQVSYIVESGEGYTANFAYSGVGRPFMQTTKDMITSSDIIETAFARELSKALGIKCIVRK